MSFYWGHQGYEYVDLGRGWQTAPVRRACSSGSRLLSDRSGLPCVRKKSSGRSLAVPAFGRRHWIVLRRRTDVGTAQHLSIVEYWRWWVVHLWVEGFFEVFATTVIAFFFTRLKLIRPKVAAEGALLSATIYLAGGIIGTGHHLYFSGRRQSHWPRRRRSAHLKSCL